MTALAIKAWSFIYGLFFGKKKQVGLRLVKSAPIVKSVKSTIPETLSELLDHIEGQFDGLKLPNSKFSDLHKKDMKALRTIGVHVPNPWLMPWNKVEDEIVVDISNGLPNTVCISLSGRADSFRQTKKNLVDHKMFYAIKQPNIPAGFTRHSGTPYIFGLGCALGDKESDPNDKLWWISMMGTVDSNGLIRFCSYLGTEHIRVPVKNASDRRIFGKTRTITYRKWDRPFLLKADKSVNKDMSDEYVELHMKNMVAACFEWWGNRGKRWSVAVKKDKSRVTFGIEYENTKKYFADRNKEIKAADGKAKRIIHHVNEHTRTLGNGKVSVVKEHIRGIREFQWKGYFCVVVAPKFTSDIVTSTFSLPPVSEEDMLENVRYLDQVDVAKELVEFEDSDKRRIA